MPDNLSEPLLETLIKLAAFGATGVGIVGIVWSGWLIRGLPDNASKELHRTVRYFLVACVILAAIAGVFGVWNALIKASTIQEQKLTISEQTQTIEKTGAELNQVSQELEEKTNQFADLNKRLEESQLLAVRVEELLKTPPATLPEPVTIELESIGEQLRAFVRPTPE